MSKQILGRTNYGQAIGILMLDTVLQRIPGDIGNATTFPFPVVYKVIKGASPERLVQEGDRSLIDQFVEGGRELEAGGVRAITTSCGFMAIFQKEIAAALSVPFFSSSLLQAKLVHSLLGSDKKIGILTNEADHLDQRHFAGVGIEAVPKVVYGMDGTWLGKAFYERTVIIDSEQIRKDIVARARLLAEENPDVGAIVLECTNMPPYACYIQEELGLPVFDIVTLTKYVYNAVVAQPYHGYL